MTNIGNTWNIDRDREVNISQVIFFGKSLYFFAWLTILKQVL